MSSDLDQPDGGCSSRLQGLKTRAYIYLLTGASIQMIRTTVRELNSTFAIPLSNEEVEEAIQLAYAQRDKPKENDYA